MPDTSFHRREATLVAALTLLGAILRFWGPGRVGLNHFDEGIYALAGTWIRSPRGLAGMSPEVIAYAPPLFPTLVGVSYLFFGISDVGAILVSQVLGTLTIPAVGWVGRRTFGPGAGAAAAALAAISGPHIAFSRMALTDSTFLLCWVLALGFGGRFLERPGILRAIPLGLMVGLAQNAKYNGYLTGGIVGFTAIWGLVVPSSLGRSGSWRAIAYGLIAAAIALAIYWPWYQFVQAQPGGYAALLKHHQSYLSGPSEWSSHWKLQTAQATALSGRIVANVGWGAIAWLLAWIGAWAVAYRRLPESRSSRWNGMRFRLGLLLGTGVMGVAANAPWWVALGMLPWLATDSRPSVRVVALAWLVMAILTPFYHPYARLWLPLHSLHWLILSGAILRTGPDWIPSDERICISTWRRLKAPQTGLAVGVLAAIVLETVASPRHRQLGSPIEPTDGLRQVCDRVVASAIPGLQSTPQRVLVVSRPPVTFYLGSRLDMPVVRRPDLATVASEIRPGDLVVLDSLLFPMKLSDLFPMPRAFSSFRIRGMPQFGDTPTTTLLDADPGLALDDGKPVDTRMRLNVLSVGDPKLDWPR